MLVSQGTGTTPLFQVMSGDATLSSAGALTLATVNANTGIFQGLTLDGKGRVTAAQSVNARVTNPVVTRLPTRTSGDVTGLGFAIGAGEIWTVEWNLAVTAISVVAGFQLTGQFPASPADLNINVFGATAAAGFAFDNLTAFSSPTAASYSGGAAGAARPVRITACITNGVNAGLSVQLQVKSSSSSTHVTVVKDSYMIARRIA